MDDVRYMALAPSRLEQYEGGEVMSNRVVCVTREHDLDERMSMMTRQRYRHLPVVDDSCKLVGIISMGDCVAHMLQEKQHEVRYLHEYISGAYPA